MRTLATPRDCGRGGRVAQMRDDFITIDVEADGFLYNMVRAIVGTLVQVGCGSRPESWPGEVLCADGPPRRRPHRAAARALLG